MTSLFLGYSILINKNKGALKMSMKLETYQRVKPLTHYALLGVSIALTMGLFTGFSDNPFFSVIWAVLAFVFEMIKDFSIAETKTFMRDHKELSGWEKSFKATLRILPYVGFAFISLVASAGFALNSIQSQSFSAEINNQSIEQSLTDDTIYDYQIEIQKGAISRTESSIESLDNQMDDLIRIQQEENESYSRSATYFVEQIEKLNQTLNAQIKELERLVSLKTELTRQRNEERSETQSDRELVAIDTFTLIGKEVNMSGEDVMKYLMYLLALLLEIFTAMTATPFEKAKVESMDRRKFKTYLDKMFETDSKRLVKDEEIVESTILSLAEAKSFKKLLMETTYKGIPLVEMGRGIGTKANYTKDDIWKIIELKNKLS